MPTYEYICEGCGEKFEFFQSMSSPALKSHPHCSYKEAKVKRIVSGGSGLIFKGSGFYLTDYKNSKKDVNSEKSPKKESKKKEEPPKVKQKKEK